MKRPEKALLSDRQPNVTAQLAQFAADLRYSDLPDEIQHRSRFFLLDAVGIMLAAVLFHRTDGQSELENFVDLAHTDGPASLIGLGRTSTPSLAALVNGTLSEVLDCQDTNLAARMHNGSAAIPVALALSETGPAMGQEILTAIVAGYEIGARLSLSIQPSHWHRGFQATGTIGSCGATATAGHILGFDARRMQHALGISGFVLPVSNSDNFFKGYSIKPIHGGQAAACALTAAYLAKAGYEAGPLEGEPPRHHAILYTLSDGRPDLGRALSGLGENWETREVGFKPYPVGLLNVGPIQVALELRDQHEIDVRNIDRIEVVTFKEAAQFTGTKYTTPRSNFIDCHLSTPFCVAAALIDGELTLRQLVKSRIADTSIHELASRVTVTENPDMSAMYPRYWPAEMTIHLRQGASVSRRVDEVNWSPRRPPSWQDLCNKFRTMTKGVIRSENAEAVIAEIGRFDQAVSSKRLMSLIAGTRRSKTAD